MTATPCRAHLSMPSCHRLLADGLAEAELAIHDGDGIVLKDDVDRLIGQHLARLEPLHVGSHADDAMRIVANQVGLDEMLGDAAGLDGLAAGMLEYGGDQIAEFVGSDFHGLLSARIRLRPIVVDIAIRLPFWQAGHRLPPFANGAL